MLALPRIHLRRRRRPRRLGPRRAGMRDRARPACRGGLTEGKAMSVAFRRESDEEHKEPRFELPIPPGPNLVTAAGLETGARPRSPSWRPRSPRRRTRPALAERAARACATGAPAWPPPSSRRRRPTDEAAFGSRVTFRLNGAERTHRHRRRRRGRPAAGKIAFSAPLARALIGAGPGDFADFGGKADAIEMHRDRPDRRGLTASGRKLELPATSWPLIPWRRCTRSSARRASNAREFVAETLRAGRA